MDTENRSFKVELRADTKGDNILTGYAAVFDSASVELPPGFIEVIKPGTFKSSLSLDADIKCLWNHNDNEPLGRTPETLNLREDNVGLYFELKIPNTNRGRDLIELVRHKIADQCSFQFQTLAENWIDRGDDIPLRELLDVRLIEVSCGVVFAAYPATSVALRNAPQSIRRKVEHVEPAPKDVDAEADADLTARFNDLLTSIYTEL